MVYHNIGLLKGILFEFETFTRIVVFALISRNTFVSGVIHNI
jgi:hypothetical protein